MASSGNDVTISSLTTQQLVAQWTNPNDVLSVLLVIGGGIVRNALAQTSGHFYTPVCFSFGWVAYSFDALVGVIGDGRLLPLPDHPVRVMNLESGYVRENRNWILGRILRDNEVFVPKSNPPGDGAFRISVYEALPRNSRLRRVGYQRIRVSGVLIMLTQLGISAVPAVLDNDWGVLLVTGVGTLLALLAGSLPQWRVEKLPSRRKSEKNIALTSGNGSQDVMIVLGMGESLDLEELAASESPRSSGKWSSFPLSSPFKTDKRKE